MPKACKNVCTMIVHSIEKTRIPCMQLTDSCSPA